jgi:hypothetical protein
MKNAKQNILIISYTNHDTDPRVIRQISALHSKFVLYTAALTANKSVSTNFIELRRSASSPVQKIKKLFQLFLRQFDDMYWDAARLRDYQAIEKFTYNVIVANDIDTLPLAVKYKEEKNRSCKIYFDAHEYHPLEFEDNLKWTLTQKKYKTFLCRKYLKQADFMTTVSSGIADEYQKVFGVRPDVITNATAYYDLAPAQVLDTIKLVHHGAAIRERKVELMIQMMDHLPENFHFTFILMPNDHVYLQELQLMARTYGSRITFATPVSVREIPTFINRFDIGVFLLPPNNFNYKNALPNKLFEFIQARLCIAIGPSPEMEKVVRRFDLGVVSATFNVKDLSCAISQLSVGDIMRYKENSNAAAAVLNAKTNMSEIEKIVTQLATQN